jgi:hypothetical protein
MEVCVTLGQIGPAEARKLKAAGVTAYNCGGIIGMGANRRPTGCECWKRSATLIRLLKVCSFAQSRIAPFKTDNFLASKGPDHPKGVGCLS